LLVAVLVEGERIVAIRMGKITVDGLDATITLNRLLRGLRFDAVLLSGISFAGFNLIDPHAISRNYRKPTIVVSGSRPNNNSVKKALTLHFKDWRTRWAIISRLGAIHRIQSCGREPPLFFEVVGATVQKARFLIRQSARLGRLPEPLRVARIVAKSLTLSMVSP
jgi:hypothetical protein